MHIRLQMKTKINYAKTIKAMHVKPNTAIGNITSNITETSKAHIKILTTRKQQEQPLTFCLLLLSALQPWQAFTLSAFAQSRIPTHPTALWQQLPHHPFHLSLSVSFN